jgi:hypothetical protein
MMMTKKYKTIDIAFLRSILHYNPETGILTWKERENNPRFNTSFANKRAGNERTLTHNNNVIPYTFRRLSITYNGKSKEYVEHRIAWAIYHGSDIPEGLQIDHINGDPCDNRIDNLRTVTIQGNAQNRCKPSNNTSGVVGVSYNKREKRWRSYIKIEGKQKHIGSFINKEDAIEERKKAEIEYGFHENHGRANNEEE